MHRTCQQALISFEQESALENVGDTLQASKVDVERGRGRYSEYHRYPRRDSGGSILASVPELDPSPIGNVKHAGCRDFLIWRYEGGKGARTLDLQLRGSSSQAADP